MTFSIPAEKKYNEHHQQRISVTIVCIISVYVELFDCIDKLLFSIFQIYKQNVYLWLVDKNQQINWVWVGDCVQPSEQPGGRVLSTRMKEHRHTF